MEKRDIVLARTSLAVVDVVCWAAATLALVAARYDFRMGEVHWWHAGLYFVSAAVLQVTFGWLSKLYRGRTRPGSFSEASLIARILLMISVSLAIVFMGILPAAGALVGFPPGIALIVPFGAVVLMLAARFLLRGYVNQSTVRKRKAKPREDVLVYGAGYTGAQVARLLAGDPKAPYRVVGFIDDDPAKRYLQLSGAQVLGTGKDLLDKVAQTGAQRVILAMTDATPAFKNDLARRLDAAGLPVMVLPPVKEMVGGRISIAQLHELDVNDLLGRAPIEINLGEIADYLSGKVVLVTGAGGSIGSEIARQVHNFGPKELVCLDRDESGLHGVQLSIYGRGLLDTPDMVLCDIRDKTALNKVFAAHQPDVVFHAAALKHLPLLEQYPDEGWKTNVLGTLNVLECSVAHGVQRVVNISTDKAADPTSILGGTKRRAEEMTSWFAEQGAGTYVSVRFGNVLGSRGSMLHTFYQQISKGGPVTVVHPDITRYFMTIPEACQLVIQAGAIGDPGDVMVLDMGEPVKILDVAQRLIRQSGKDIDIVFTGLRPGEKMHEVLFSNGEAPDRLSHPLISRVHVPASNPNDVMRAGLAAVQERAAKRDQTLKEAS